MSIKKNHLVTLKDIAKVTGFSVNSVSCAMRGRGTISKATAQQIRSVAAEMGYVHNSIASAMRTGQTRIIAIILGDIGNAYFSIMVKELEFALKQYKYIPIILNTDENEELQYTATRTAISMNVDGVILFPTCHSDRSERLLQSAGLPFVLLGRHLKNENMDFIISDDIKGGRIATEYLFSRGHKRILTFIGPEFISCAAERHKGYLLAHHQAGLPVDPKLIYPCGVAVDNDETLMHIDQILTDATDYTAVFTFNDSIAFAVIDRLSLIHPEVCYDVVGYDHLQSHTRFGFRLASVDINKKAMACKAIEVLLDRMNGKQGMSPFYHVMIDVQLAIP